MSEQVITLLSDPIAKEDRALVLKFGGFSIDAHGIRHPQIEQMLAALQEEMLQFGIVFLVTGGGEHCAIVQAQYENDDDKDRVGIGVTQEHAEDVRVTAKRMNFTVADVVPTIFLPAIEEDSGETSALEIVKSRIDMPPETTLVVACGGLNEIHQTTDAVAAQMAQLLIYSGYHTKLIILTNVDAIYTGDPNKVVEGQEPPRAIREAATEQVIEIGALPAQYSPKMKTAVDNVATNRIREAMRYPNAEGAYVGTVWANKLVRRYGEEIAQGDEFYFEDIRAFMRGEEVKSGTILRSTFETHTRRNISDEDETPIEYYPS